MKSSNPLFYIYKITNLINGKIYIGKTYSIRIRWSAHKSDARCYTPTTHLYRAMNKYGFKNFKIEELATFNTEKECLLAETAYIKKYHSNDRNIGYNLTEGGEGSSGYKHTEETKKLMGAIKKITFVGENNPFFGKTHTPETRKKMSVAASKRIGNKNPFYGKKHSEKSKQLMSNNQKGKSASISSEDIKDIKYKKKTLKMTYKEIAVQYGMHWKTISKAARGNGAYEVKKSKPLMRDNPKVRSVWLSEENIKDIKYKKNTLKMTYKEIAIQYEMHWRTISEAARSKGSYEVNI